MVQTLNTDAPRRRARLVGWLRQIAVLVLLVLGTSWAVQTWQTRHVPASLPLTTPLQIVAPSGQTRRTTLGAWLADQAQPVAGLYVWADWCPICQAQESTLDALTREQVVLTVALRSGPAAAVAQHLRQRGLSWTTAVDSDGALAAALGVRAVPSWMTVDQKGGLHTPSVGWTSAWGLRARLLWATWVAPTD